MLWQRSCSREKLQVLFVYTSKVNILLEWTTDLTTQLIIFETNTVWFQHMITLPLHTPSSNPPLSTLDNSSLMTLVNSWYFPSREQLNLKTIMVVTSYLMKTAVQPSVGCAYQQVAAGVGTHSDGGSRTHCRWQDAQPPLRHTRARAPLRAYRQLLSQGKELLITAYSLHTSLT